MQLLETQSSAKFTVFYDINKWENQSKIDLPIYVTVCTLTVSDYVGDNLYKVRKIKTLDF